ncbi:MAG: DUF559 domain-containing protein [Rhizobiaceae bacterium]
MGERCRAKRGGEGEMPAHDESSRSRRRPGATSRSRQLRTNGKVAEALLWTELKNRDLSGHEFVRQLPIGPYFADFCCRGKKLAVEVDGSRHPDSPHDRRRDTFMLAQGHSTLRFWSVDVLRARPALLDTILAAPGGRLEAIRAADLRFLPAPTPSSTPEPTP